MTDCEEIYANGTRTDGLYYVSPDGRCPFLVYCDMTHGGWTVIQVRGVSVYNYLPLTYLDEYLIEYFTVSYFHAMFSYV